uniref:C2H2-type domain-containing protein n=1 Tax=Ditylenchus dipsaci TaxID=166011 RepID=A0A915CPM4_9BILA
MWRDSSSRHLRSCPIHQIINQTPSLTNRPNPADSNNPVSSHPSESSTCSRESELLVTATTSQNTRGRCRGMRAQVAASQHSHSNDDEEMEGLDHQDHQEEEEEDEELEEMDEDDEEDSAARQAADRHHDLIICADCRQEFSIGQFALFLEHKIGRCDGGKHTPSDDATASSSLLVDSASPGVLRGGGVGRRKNVMEESRFHRSSSTGLLDRQASTTSLVMKLQQHHLHQCREVGVDTSDFEMTDALCNNAKLHTSCDHLNKPTSKRNSSCCSSTTTSTKVFTCHSCKQKCSDIWGLLEHVFMAHGFRISDENLPHFNYPTSTPTATATGVIVQTSTPNTTLGSLMGICGPGGKKVAGARRRPQQLVQDSQKREDGGQHKSDENAIPQQPIPMLLERQPFNNLLASLVTPPPPSSTPSQSFLAARNRLNSSRSLGNGSKSAFSLNAFCSERLKEIAEKVGEPALDPNSLISPISILNKTPSSDSLRSPDHKRAYTELTDDELHQTQNLAAAAAAAQSAAAASTTLSLAAALQQHQQNNSKPQSTTSFSLKCWQLCRTTTFP